jgi:hypothetical protein
MSLPERPLVPNPRAAAAGGAGLGVDKPSPEIPEIPGASHCPVSRSAVFSAVTRVSTSRLDGANNKEVAMSRTTRRTLAFDAMEGRVLLSAGMGHPAAAAHPAAIVHRAKAQVRNVLLNGTLAGIPFGTASQDGITVSAFTLKGKTQTMGRVTASLGLTDTLIAPGKQPDLSNATLTLSNARGSVQIKTAASPSSRYIFIVTSGTGAYASAYGSGTAVISYNGRMHEYQVALRSSLH